MKKILLAGILLVGINLSLNAETIEDLQKACDNGNEWSCGDLAAQYLYGFQYGAKVKKDLNKAMEIYIKSCGRGSDLGCTGVVSAEQPVDKMLNTKGVSVLTEQCNNGVDSACYALGSVYWKGKMAEKNQEKALEYYKKACEMKKGSAWCRDYEDKLK